MSSQDGVMLWVRPASKKDIELQNVLLTDTVGQLKKRIYEMEGVPPEQQCLAFDGNVLEDSRTVRDGLEWQYLTLTVPAGSFPHLSTPPPPKVRDHKADEEAYCTPDLLDLAVGGGVSTHLVQKLLDEGGDVNDGALHAAIHRPPENGSNDVNAAVLRLLLAQPDIDVNGPRPLHQACETTDPSWSVPILLAHKDIDVNLALADGGSFGGFTPLHCAICFNKLDVVKLLLAHPRIDINKTNDDGESPLQYAVESERPQIVQLLLGMSGIDCTLKNDDGATAMDTAKELSEKGKNMSEIISMLKASESSAGTSSGVSSSGSNDVGGRRGRDTGIDIGCHSSSAGAAPITMAGRPVAPCADESDSGAGAVSVQRRILVGEKVDVLKGGGWVQCRMVVKVHAGPLYDVDVSDGRSVIVLEGKLPEEVRAYGPDGSVVPRWSEADIDAMKVQQLRHELKVLSISLDGLKNKALLSARLKAAMPSAAEPPTPQETASVPAAGNDTARSSKRRRLTNDTAGASCTVPADEMPDMTGFDGAIARLWWVMARHGSNNSDGCPADHMQNDKTWHHGNFTVHYTLKNEFHYSRGYVAAFTIQQRNGAALPSGFLSPSSVAFDTIAKIERAVAESYNDIIACTGGEWIVDHVEHECCEPRKLPNDRNARVYSDREQFLRALFCDQYCPDEDGSPLALDGSRGVLTFAFGFRGDASNGNSWVPHRLRPYVMPGKDTSYDAECYRRAATQTGPRVHQFIG